MFIWIYTRNTITVEHTRNKIDACFKRMFLTILSEYSNVDSAHVSTTYFIQNNSLEVIKPILEKQNSSKIIKIFYIKFRLISLLNLHYLHFEIFI